MLLPSLFGNGVTYEFLWLGAGFRLPLQEKLTVGARTWASSLVESHAPKYSRSHKMHVYKTFESKYTEADVFTEIAPLLNKCTAMFFWYACSILVRTENLHMKFWTNASTSWTTQELHVPFKKDVSWTKLCEDSWEAWSRGWPLKSFAATETTVLEFYSYLMLSFSFCYAFRDYLGTTYFLII